MLPYAWRERWLLWRGDASALRKQRSIALLKQRGVPVNSWLPRLPDDDHLRSAADVAKRCLILKLVVARAHGAPAGELRAWLERHRLWHAVSPDEETLLHAESLSERDRFAASWVIEGVKTLLWSIGRVPELEWPTALCGREVSDALPRKESDPWPFVHEACLRPASEILDAADLAYRIHWATRDACARGVPPPCDLHPAVAYERHRALSWLIYYAVPWDETDTST